MKICPSSQAQRLAVEYLERLGLGDIAHKRNPALNSGREILRNAAESGHGERCHDPD